MREVTPGMSDKGINNMGWVDRKEWRGKIKHYYYYLFFISNDRFS